MVLEQATMRLSKMGVVTQGPPEKVLKFVLLWREVGLAIHQGIFVSDRNLWTISHFRSGRSIVKYIKTKGLAIEYLQRLYDILKDWTFTEEEWNTQADETRKELKEAVDKIQQEVLS